MSRRAEPTGSMWVTLCVCVCVLHHRFAGRRKGQGGKVGPVMALWEIPCNRNVEH